MIETRFKIITVICDDCDETFESYVEQAFDSFIEELKTLGWKIECVRRNWTHTCPECNEPAGDFPDP